MKGVCTSYCKADHSDVKKLRITNMFDTICSRCRLKMPIISINNRAVTHSCICCGETVTLI